MRQFSIRQYETALDYLNNEARPLEKLRWANHIGEVPSDDVLGELNRYRNDDGGFGKALESDSRARGSTVLATLEALSILAELDVPDSNTMLTEALDWLTDRAGGFDSNRGLWPYLPDDIDASPHAPWWDQNNLEETFSGYLVNPRARVLSQLYHWPEHGNRCLGRDVLAAQSESVAVIAENLPDEVSPDTLRSLLSMVSQSSLPAEIRIRVSEAVRRMIPATVEIDPLKWNEYCLQPLEVVISLESPWMPLLADSVQQHMDYLIKAQEADGSWKPFWNWGGRYPDDWQLASREWAGVLTYRNLKAFSVFGQLPSQMTG
jgi:hypothetical protein